MKSTEFISKNENRNLSENEGELDECIGTPLFSLNFVVLDENQDLDDNQSVTLMEKDEQHGYHQYKPYAYFIFWELNLRKFDFRSYGGNEDDPLFSGGDSDENDNENDNEHKNENAFKNESANEVEHDNEEISFFNRSNSFVQQMKSQPVNNFNMFDSSMAKQVTTSKFLQTHLNADADELKVIKLKNNFYLVQSELYKKTEGEDKFQEIIKLIR